jgi:hypothetical protein
VLMAKGGWGTHLESCLTLSLALHPPPPPVMVWRVPEHEHREHGFCLIGSHAILFIEALEEFSLVPSAWDTLLRGLRSGSCTSGWSSKAWRRRRPRPRWRRW